MIGSPQFASAEEYRILEAGKVAIQYSFAELSNNNSANLFIMNVLNLLMTINNSAIDSDCILSGFWNTL